MVSRAFASARCPRLGAGAARFLLALAGGLLPRGAEPLPGVVTQVGGLFPQPLGVAERLLACLLRLFACLPALLTSLPALLTRLIACLLRLFADLARLGPHGLLGGLPGLLALGIPRLLRGLPLGAAHLPRGPGQLLAQVADGLPDVLTDLAHDVADGGGQFFFELVEFGAPVPQFLAAGFGDPVDLTPVLFVVGDQALFLEPGQPRVDRAW